MRLITLLIISTILISCGSSKNLQSEEKEDQKIIKAEIGDVKTESKEYNLKKVRIQGNVLYVQISFSGGCKSYSARLIGSEFILKSFPPKRPIKLILEKEGDCRELKEVGFTFDISNLAYKKEKGSEIILLFEGYSEPINYVFD